jgi:GGDEF domain-containing protein
MENEDGGLYKRMIAAWLSGGTAFVSLALIIAGLLTPKEVTPSTLKFLLSPSPLPTGLWIMGILAAALLFSALTIWALRDGARRARKNLREHSDLLQELRRTKGALVQTEHLMVTDPITGIPNFRSWQRHTEAWPLTDGARRLSCLILIDLDNLKALNSVSYDCANRVLELFASRAYHSMRRNEHAFKIPDRNARRETQKPVEMFRHHAGGDEFCFHVLDNMTAALGFINRLRESCADYEKEIKSLVLPEFMNTDQIEKYQLRFCAAIAPIDPGVLPEDVIGPALRSLNLAKKNQTSRLLVQFGRDSAKTPAARKIEIDQKVIDVDVALELIAKANPDENLESKAKRRKELLKQQGALKGESFMLGKLAETFSKSSPANWYFRRDGS